MFLIASTIYGWFFCLFCLGVYVYKHLQFYLSTPRGKEMRKNESSWLRKQTEAITFLSNFLEKLKTQVYFVLKHLKLALSCPRAGSSRILSSDLGSLAGSDNLHFTGVAAQHGPDTSRSAHYYSCIYPRPLISGIRQSPRNTYCTRYSIDMYFYVSPLQRLRHCP